MLTIDSKLSCSFRYVDRPSTVGLIIHDVSRMRCKFIDHGLKPLGIMRAQWWALANISRHADIGIVQTDLANFLETDTRQSRVDLRLLASPAVTIERIATVVNYVTLALFRNGVDISSAGHVAEQAIGA